MVAGVLLSDVHAKNITSRSYFPSRQQFQSASPEMLTGCRYDKDTVKKTSWGGRFQAVLFGGSSTNSDDIGTYLMPFGSASALVSEELIADASAVLHAQNFNILTQRAIAAPDLVTVRNAARPDAFKSTISLRPREWSVGLGLFYQHFFNRASGNPFWVSISTPIVHVERDVRLTEVVTSDGNGVVTAAQIAVINEQPLFGSMEDALKQQAWNYGKIDTHAHKKTGIGDIEAKLGCVLVQTDWVLWDLACGVIIPTSNKPKNHFIFEPQLGNGQHIGIMGQTDMRFMLIEDDGSSWSFSYESAVNVQYLFENTQRRSFDLVDKPWSRYIEMYESQAQATQYSALAGTAMNLRSTPGINQLTLDTKVKPGANVTWNNAFVLNCCSCEFELGYNLHARETESLTLKHEWSESAALKKATGGGHTNSKRDITASRTLNGPTIQDMLYTPIKKSDINFKSAASPSLVTHTIYAAAGYHWNYWSCPLGITYGGSYEFPSANKALSRWTLWLKADVSF